MCIIWYCAGAVLIQTFKCGEEMYRLLEEVELCSTAVDEVTTMAAFVVELVVLGVALVVVVAAVVVVATVLVGAGVAAVGTDATRMLVEKVGGGVAPGWAVTRIGTNRVGGGGCIRSISVGSHVSRSEGFALMVLITEPA